MDDLQEVIQRVVPYSNESVAQSLATLGRQLEQLRATGLAQAEAVAENTRAIGLNTQVQSGGGAGTTAVKAIESVSKFLGGGLAFTPLVSGLVNLFRGSRPELPPLAPYVAPSVLRLDAGLSSAYAGAAAVDYGQDGLPRPAVTPQAAPTANVTVQVQAMDSRSFLDHSAEIARAVREAMLNSHSLNDVINEM